MENTNNFIVATNGDNAPEILPFDIIYFDEHAEADAGDVIVYHDVDEEGIKRISRVKAWAGEGRLMELSNGQRIRHADVCGVANEVRRVYGIESYVLSACAKWLNGYCERHKDDEKGVTFDEAFQGLMGMLGALALHE